MALQHPPCLCCRARARGTSGPVSPAVCDALGGFVGMASASALGPITGPHSLEDFAMSRTVPITFNCSVNEKKFKITGEIELSDGEGSCSATPQFDRSSLPPGFQPELLSYVSITGYPAASLSMGKAVNPFDDLHANFKTTREIDLGKHGQLKTTYYSLHRGTPNEEINFDVSGNVKLEKRIVSISPVNEVWRPTEEPNEFTGEMTFTWHLEDGSVVTGYASGRYEVESSIPLQREQMRIITFDLESSVDSFKQSEIIKLYDLAEWQQVLPRAVNRNLVLETAM